MIRPYDLKQVIITIAGITLSGFGESDAISFEWDGDLVEKTTTADGRTLYSRTNLKGCTATMVLSQQSRAIPLLMGLLETQHGVSIGIAPPVLPPQPFAMIDPSTGDGFFSLNSVFMNMPAPSKGKTVGEVEFRLHLEQANASLGSANLI